MREITNCPFLRVLSTVLQAPASKELDRLGLWRLTSSVSAVCADWLRLAAATLSFSPHVKNVRGDFCQ